jgi:hypothetical protein
MRNCIVALKGHENLASSLSLLQPLAIRLTANKNGGNTTKKPLTELIEACNTLEENVEKLSKESLLKQPQNVMRFIVEYDCSELVTFIIRDRHELMTTGRNKYDPQNADKPSPGSEISSDRIQKNEKTETLSSFADDASSLVATFVSAYIAPHSFAATPYNTYKTQKIDAVKSKVITNPAFKKILPMYNLGESIRNNHNIDGQAGHLLEKHCGAFKTSIYVDFFLPLQAIKSKKEKKINLTPEEKDIEIQGKIVLETFIETTILSRIYSNVTADYEKHWNPFRATGWLWNSTWGIRATNTQLGPLEADSTFTSTINWLVQYYHPGASPLYRSSVLVSTLVDGPSERMVEDIKSVQKKYEEEQRTKSATT